MSGLMTTTALPAPGQQPPLRRGPKEAVLVSLRSAREAATAWEVETARLVTDWVCGHRIADHLPADGGALREQVIELDEGVVRPSLPGLQAPMRLAGPGAPLVWDLAFCELATTLSLSLDAARAYVGEVVELAFRLPCLWERVRCGEVRLWRARDVARSTMRLPADGAASVDAQLAPVIGSCSGAQVRRAVTAALHRFDPEAAEAERRAAADGQRFDIHIGDLAGPERPGSAGVVAVDGLLDTADALDLDAAVSARAAELRTCGSEDNLDVRRARALGEIARHDQTLPFQAGEGTGVGTGSARTGDHGAQRASVDDSGTRHVPLGDPDADDAHAGEFVPASAPAAAAAGRRMQLILHLNANALAPFGAGAGPGLGRCENTRTPVSAEQIRDWCASPGTRVTVLPVIDLAGHDPVEKYEVPASMHAQVTMRDPQCVFPFCTRSARRADLDHIVPFDEGGPTCGCNLAPLCRRHHRAKTHADWSYVMVIPGTYLWCSAADDRYLVDGRGTSRVPAVGEVCAHAGTNRLLEPPPWAEPAAGGAAPADPGAAGLVAALPEPDGDPPPF